MPEGAGEDDEEEADGEDLGISISTGTGNLITKGGNYEGESDNGLQACSHGCIINCCRRFRVWLWRVACAMGVGYCKTWVRESSEGRGLMLSRKSGLLAERKIRVEIDSRIGYFIVVAADVCT